MPGSRNIVDASLALNMSVPRDIISDKQAQTGRNNTIQPQQQQQQQQQHQQEQLMIPSHKFPVLSVGADFPREGRSGLQSVGGEAEFM